MFTPDPKSPSRYGYPGLREFFERHPELTKQERRHLADLHLQLDRHKKQTFDDASWSQLLALVREHFLKEPARRPALSRGRGRGGLGR